MAVRGGRRFLASGGSPLGTRLCVLLACCLLKQNAVARGKSCAPEVAHVASCGMSVGVALAQERRSGHIKKIATRFFRLPGVRQCRRSRAQLRRSWPQLCRTRAVLVDSGPSLAWIHQAPPTHRSNSG